MATLFDLAQAYLNRALPETFKYDRTQPPTIGPITRPEPIPGPVVPLLPRPGGNEEGFSVYNPDPNRTKTKDNYSPYAARQYYARPDSDVGIPSGILSNSEFLYGKKSPLDSLTSMMPGKKILEGIASLLPTSDRGILENELTGQGFAIDDVGRFVAATPGTINTAENIMAGYSAYRTDADTFQKRRDLINAKMSDTNINPKTGKTYKEEKLAALDEAERRFFAAKDLTTGISDQKKKAKDPTYKSEAEKITEGITTAEADSGSDMLEGIETILGTKPIIEYRDSIMDMVSPPTQISLENIIEQNKAKQKMQDLINMSRTADDIDNDSFFKDATADSGTIMSDANTKTKTKTKTKTPSFNIHGGGDGPVERPGPSKSKSVSKTNKDYGQFGRRQQQTSQGGGAGNSSGGCFLKGTLITMLDGTRKPVEQVDLGNEVAIGGKVFATGKFLVKNLHDYKGIKVSGSHMVSENNKWVRVEDSEHGKLLGNEEHTVYVFGSENRRILINDILFTDYFEVNEQDKLMNNEEDFFDNWKLYAKQDSGNNVDIINAS